MPEDFKPRLSLTGCSILEVILGGRPMVLILFFESILLMQLQCSGAWLGRRLLCQSLSGLIYCGGYRIHWIFFWLCLLLDKVDWNVLIQLADCAGCRLLWFCVPKWTPLTVCSLGGSAIFCLGTDSCRLLLCILCGPRSHHLYCICQYWHRQESTCLSQSMCWTTDTIYCLLSHCIIPCFNAHHFSKHILLFLLNLGEWDF